MTAVNPFPPDVDIRDTRGRKAAVLRHRTMTHIADALDWAIDQRDNKYKARSSTSGSKDWTGTASAEEYRDMLRDGWQAGVEGVEGLDGLTDDRAERLQFVRNVAGAFPIVPAALAGDPLAMLDPQPRPVDSVRQVTLVIDASFNAGVRGSTALDFARKVMKLVAWLQAEQIDTTVYCVLPVQMHKDRIVYCVTVRNAGDVLQPERLATCVHPSFLRRGWFALCEREYHEYEMPECRVCESGYGSSRHVTAEELRTALPDAQSVILLPKVGDGDPEDAVREALNMKLRTG